MALYHGIRYVRVPYEANARALSALAARMPSTPACGFHKDCARQYTALEVNRSAAQWRAGGESSAVFSARRAAARQACATRKYSNKAANTVGKEAGTLDTGGWCLAVRANAANVARRRKDLEFMEVSLANGQSYTLPKPHVAADKPIVAYLDRLLRGSEGPSFLSVADFGAGVGQYGHALRSIDARHRWTGYDGAGNIEEATGGYVGWFDLTVPLSLPRADWVLSLEVGEHIPPEHEMMMVRNLHAHNCRGVVLSWAYLGKYGVGHVNNHGRAYLIPLFEELGYRHNRAASRALQRGRPKVPGRQIDLTRNVSQPWFWLRSVEVYERITPLRGSGCGGASGDLAAK